MGTDGDVVVAGAGRRRRNTWWVIGVVVILVALVAAGTAGWRSRSHDPRDLPGWHLQWADEFDGQTLDGARWKIENQSTFGDGNGELACLMNRSENVVLGRGVLSLRALREQPPLACNADDTRFPAGRGYSSAFVSTKGTASWTYGRFEIRARLPTQSGSSEGLWPAFWLRPSDGGVGELDVLEAIGSGVGGAESSAVHQTLWYDYTGSFKKQSTAFEMPAGRLPSDGFHVYATEWEPTEIRWYVDGRLTFRRTAQTTPWLAKAFSRPFFLRLNLAVGGSWPGEPTASTTFPADYALDYVRVYQR